jgi:hypothetical protein
VGETPEMCWGLGDEGNVGGVIGKNERASRQSGHGRLRGRLGGVCCMTHGRCRWRYVSRAAINGWRERAAKKNPHPE